MAGLQTPIVVSHGEGFADSSQKGDLSQALAAMRYVDNRGQPTETYPLNPNGSPGGITSVTTDRWALHGDDASRRARIPLGIAILASQRLGREFTLDAHVPQCAQVGWAKILLFVVVD